MSEAAEHRVDPWRFMGGFLKNALSSAIPDEPAYDGIPWAPLHKPVAESRVADADQVPEGFLVVGLLLGAARLEEAQLEGPATELVGAQDVLAAGVARKPQGAQSLITSHASLIYRTHAPRRIGKTP